MWSPTLSSPRGAGGAFRRRRWGSPDSAPPPTSGRPPRERGAHVAPTPARWSGPAQRPAHRRELRTPLICHNGAHVQEPDDGAELLHMRIPTAAAHEIAAFWDEGGFRGCNT